jgi:hypothetical protein
MRAPTCSQPTRTLSSLRRRFTPRRGTTRRLPSSVPMAQSMAVAAVATASGVAHHGTVVYTRRGQGQVGYVTSTRRAEISESLRRP